MPPIAKPWFRMYSDILDNEKIDHLRVPLVKTWLKLLALANVNKPRGRLPPLKRISYRLRLNESACAAAIAELMAVGLIDHEGDRLVMHDWDDWQKDSDARATDGRQKRGGYAADAPHISGASAADAPLMRRLEGEREKDREKDREKEGEQEREGEVIVPVVRAFERCFGRLLSPMEIESIKALDEEHPRERIDYALRESAELGKRSVRYIQTICENQSRTGDDHERKQVGRNAGSAQAARDTSADAAAVYASFGITNLPVFLGPDRGAADAGLEALDASDDPPRLEVR